MRSLFPLLVLCLLACQPFCVRAQAQTQEETGKNRVVVVENVKLDYAQVLNVEPVYQTLRATRTEEQCDEPEPQPVAPTEPPVVEEGRFSRLLESVKDVFGKGSPTPETTLAPPPTSTRRNCRVVEVPREFRRPVAYDVNYVYKGTKYRSRLPEDPGNRLRVRVSVTPYIPDAILAPAR